MSAGSGATGATGTSAGPIELGVRFFLQDQFSGPVERMKAGMQGLKGEFTAFQDNLRSARALSTSIAAGGMAMLFGMGQAVQEGADFLFMLRSVEAITQGTVTQMEALRDTAIEVGRTTIFSPADIAGGMRFMAMAGQSAETISKTIGSATNLAGATMTRLEGKMGAADILTNALKAFGWEDARSAQMADILTMAANSANVTLTDLGNSIRYVAATSRNLRIPVEETTGFLMSLGNAGIQASMAGVATENMYRYLAMSLSKFPTKRAEAAWASLGINKSQLTDSMGNLLPVYEILGMIKGKLAGFGTVEQQNILRDIFGVRGLRAAGTLINNLDEAVGFINKLKDPATAGTAAEKMALMMDSLHGSIQRVSDSWMGFKIAFTESIEGPLRYWLDGLSAMLAMAEKFLRTPLGKFTSQMVAGLTVALVVVNTFRAAVTGLAYAFRTLNVSVASMNASVSTAMAFMMGKQHLGKYAQPIAYYQAQQKAGIIGPLPPHMDRRTGMMVVPTGVAYGGKFKDAVTKRFVSVSNVVSTPTTVAAATRSSAMTVVGRGLLGAGRGLLGLFGGPVGLAIVGASIAIPYLVNSMSNNTKAVDSNTQAIQDTNALATSSEYYAMISNYKVAEVVTTISKNLEKMLTDRKIDMNKITEILQSQDINKLGEFLGSAMMNSNNPLVIEPN